ncbi:HNH endonuclease signature motif containing protein [Prosthecobacter sp.]|uniref:HNH endonuclease n=1 Tax=Prosthecobacter sp. TaxID=1965333 RepID=UPI002AB85AC6|nr:HNH endonuclease signature motif containing protein [Prosthecobacter sp.]MDZ4406067.1 HNH endonuclease signature motif containing protein [Prosthecobacter sp.]
MSVPSDLAALVRDRAGHHCEYCGMCQSLQGATFHLEHVVPVTCGGATTAENLALACPSCNLHKSDRSHADDPDTGLVVSLFHPRQHIWSLHFEWQGTTLAGLTAIGRVTIQALDLNHTRRLRVREAERVFGLFPPE